MVKNDPSVGTGNVVEKPDYPPEVLRCLEIAKKGRAFHKNGQGIIPVSAAQDLHFSGIIQLSDYKPTRCTCSCPIPEKCWLLKEGIDRDIQEAFAAIAPRPVINTAAY
ncbi:MAG: hypothetical protein ACM3KR_07345 [Deltaproteobacteria bacterium]